jgi:hypothetical protein
MLRAAVTVVGFALLIACGGGILENSDGAVTSPCPTDPVTEGASCAVDGLTCEWGGDMRGDPCRTVATCAGAQWQVRPPSAERCPPLREIGACPPDTTGDCTENDTCAGADKKTCWCTRCAPTAPICYTQLSWYCHGPETAAGCPVLQPNFGESCAAEGADCPYFFYMCDQPVRDCTHGLWTPGQSIGCPR